ncbi:hypothetical protein A2U01_0082263, partial [Trifolium medium]|nr:hypothetical protein [Trifolium medium]
LSLALASPKCLKNGVFLAPTAPQSIETGGALCQSIDSTQRKENLHILTGSID